MKTESMVQEAGGAGEAKQDAREQTARYLEEHPQSKRTFDKVMKGLELGGLALVAGYVAWAIYVSINWSVQRDTGKESVERVTIAQVDADWQPLPGTEQTLDVDTIGLAVGLSPLAELAWIAGCKFTHVAELGGWIPVHNEDMQTSLPGLYVAGDAAGIEEASTAMEQGRLAGLAAAQALGHLPPEQAERKKAEVRQRLDSLRIGSFGQDRITGKQQIQSAFEDYEREG